MKSQKPKLPSAFYYWLFEELDECHLPRYSHANLTYEYGMSKHIYVVEYESEAFTDAKEAFAEMEKEKQLKYVSMWKERLTESMESCAKLIAEAFYYEGCNKGETP